LNSPSPAIQKRAAFNAVIKGMTASQKSLPTYLLYDRRGSQLFERIMALEEYYVTKTERQILQQNIAEITARLGEKPLLADYGSGNSAKTRLLLDNIKPPSVYMPVDISQEFLDAAAKALRRDYPDWEIAPVNADFTGDFKLPRAKPDAGKTVIFFPGSTIGNFERAKAVALLRRMSAQCRPAGCILIGVDLIKERDILLRAYNDREGATAEFNLNILNHVNRLTDADFCVANFKHRAVFDEDNERIVMQLISRAAHDVTVGEHKFRIDKNEGISTEYSHKYSVEGFGNMASKAGLNQERVWRDEQELFSLQLLAPA